MPEPDDQQQQGPAQLREARDRAVARAAELETQLAASNSLARENAMLRAGVDLESPVGKLFAKGYDGELDVEAVKAEWSTLGGTPAPAAPGVIVPGQEPAPVNDGPTAAELEQQRLSGALLTEATPPGGEPSPDPWDSAYQEFNAPERRTQPADRRSAAALQHVINAANAGDPRVVFSSPGEDQGLAAQRWRDSHTG